MRKSEAILNDVNLGNNIYPRKSYLTNIYLFKVNYRNTDKKCEQCSKLTIKTPERLSTVLFGNFGHISLHFFSVSAVNFKQVNVC